MSFLLGGTRRGAVVLVLNVITLVRYGIPIVLNFCNLKSGTGYDKKAARLGGVVISEL